MSSHEMVRGVDSGIITLIVYVYLSSILYRPNEWVSLRWMMMRPYVRKTKPMSREKHAKAK